MPLSAMRRQRLDRDLTLFVLAVKTGISTNRLSLAERELVALSPAEKERVAAALGVGPGAIWPSEDQTPNNRPPTSAIA